MDVSKQKRPLLPGTNQPSPRVADRLRAFAPCGVLVAILMAAIMWYYHVPTAADLPIGDSWEELTTDWYGLGVIRGLYYRYRAPGTPEEITAWVRARLDEAGPWGNRNDTDQAAILSELQKDYPNRSLVESLGEELLSEYIEAKSKCRFDRGRALKNPGRLLVSMRARRIGNGTSVRIVHVRVSEETGEHSIVEIWDVHRLD
jgi:hypothetical protein